MSITARANPDTLLTQQAALARFGDYALRSDDLDQILHDACRLVAEALGTDLAEVVALGADGHTLMVRAGFGWSGDVADVMTTDIDGGPEGLALRSGEAVVSPDPRACPGSSDSR